MLGSWFWLDVNAVQNRTWRALRIFGQVYYFGLWIKKLCSRTLKFLLMLRDVKASRQSDLATRTDQLVSTIERLEKEIKALQATGLVAPPGCWIVRYLAKGKRGAYWYYKLQATQAIFPTKTKGTFTKYKHLGNWVVKLTLWQLSKSLREARLKDYKEL